MIDLEATLLGKNYSKFLIGGSGKGATVLCLLEQLLGGVIGLSFYNVIDIDKEIKGDENQKKKVPIFLYSGGSNQ